MAASGGAELGLKAKFLRRKIIDTSPSSLVRKLRFLDLTALGVGATLGAGAYTLTGTVARNTAGPAIIVSFLISGIASIFSGLCYAEFSARVPRAGSAYVYSFVTVGELLAWTTGWQLLLEYVIGASFVASAWSGYLDALTGNAISDYFRGAIGTWSVPEITSEPDFVAAAVTLLLSLVVCLGAKESATMNNVLTGLNVAVISFVIIAGAFYTDTSNYDNFAPFGLSGVFTGAATVFSSYVGFDVIATSAEEALDPDRNLPSAIVTCILVCCGVYMAVSTVVTLMQPYNLLDTNAPLAAAFGAHGAGWARYIISVGAMCGLSTSLITCIFPIPRIIYAIAEDGLLPPWLGAVHPRFGTPVNATLLAGGFAAVVALLFDTNTLASMMSVGTLLAYTLVSASVLVLRYREYEEAEDGAGVLHDAAKEGAAGEGKGGRVAGALPEGAAAAGSVNGGAPSRELSVEMAGTRGVAEGSSLVLRPAAGAVASSGASASGSSSKGSSKSIARAAVPSLELPRTPLLEAAAPSAADTGKRGGASPVGSASSIVPGGPVFRLWGRRAYAAASLLVCLFVLGLAVASVGLSVYAAGGLSSAAEGGMFTLMAVGGVLAIASVAKLLTLPSSTPTHLSFRVRGMPWVPLISLIVNVYLLVSLDPLTWVRFGIWCFVGALIYAFYGIKHSRAGRPPGDGGSVFTGSSAASEAAAGAGEAGDLRPFASRSAGYSAVATHEH